MEEKVVTLTGLVLNIQVQGEDFLLSKMDVPSAAALVVYASLLMRITDSPRTLVYLIPSLK